jgi:hypothetical protein
MLSINQRFGKHCSCHLQGTFTLKTGTAIFAETLVNTQHSTLHTPESRSYTFRMSCLFGHKQYTCLKYSSLLFWDAEWLRGYWRLPNEFPQIKIHSRSELGCHSLIHPQGRQLQGLLVMGWILNQVISPRSDGIRWDRGFKSSSGHGWLSPFCVIVTQDAVGPEALQWIFKLCCLAMRGTQTQ